MSLVVKPNSRTNDLKRGIRFVTRNPWLLPGFLKEYAQFKLFCDNRKEKIYLIVVWGKFVLTKVAKKQLIDSGNVAVDSMYARVRMYIHRHTDKAPSKKCSPLPAPRLQIIAARAHKINFSCVCKEIQILLQSIQARPLFAAHPSTTRWRWLD